MRFTFRQKTRNAPTNLLQRGLFAQWQQHKLRSVVIGVLAVASIGILVLRSPLFVHANACSSNGTGGGNWNTAATWTSCGGVTPQSGDSVTIAAGDTVTLDTSPTITSLSFASGATAATLSDDGTGRTLTISGTVTMGQPSSAATNAWNINTGTATVAGLITFSGATNDATKIAKIVTTTGTLNANGGITFTGSNSASAVIDMSGGAGNLNMKGALTTPANSSTFTFGTTSNFNYYDSSAQTINYPSAGKYNNLLINNSGGVTLGAAMNSGNVGGNISVQSGTLKNGGFSINVANVKVFSVSNGAAFEMSGTSGIPSLGIGATFSFGASSTVRYLQTTSPLTISSQTYGNLDLKPAGAATQYFPSGSMTVAGNLTIGDGTNAANVTANQNNTTLTVSGNVSISASSTLVNNATNPLTVGGSWSNSGTFTNSSDTVTFNATTGGKTLSGTMTGSSAFYDISFTGSGGAWSFGANSATVNNFSITNGTVTAPSTTLTINGNYSNSATFTHNSGTVTFAATSGTKNLTGTMTGSSSFYNVIINGAGGAFSMGAAIAVANNFDLTNGTFDTNGVSNYALTVAGNLTGNSGSWIFNMHGSTITVSGNWNTSAYDGLSVGTSTVVMDGTGTKTINQANGGSNPFYNLQVGAAAGKTTQQTGVIGIKNVFTLGAGTFDLNTHPFYVECNGSSNPNPLSLGSGSFGTGSGPYTGDMIVSSAQGACNMNLPGGTYQAGIGNQMGGGKLTFQGTTTIAGKLSFGCCTPSSAIASAETDLNNQNITVGAIGFGNGAPVLDGGSSTITITDKVYGSNWDNCSAGAGGCSAGPGVFNKGTSTVIFAEGSAGSGGVINSNGQSFYNLTFNGSGGSWSPSDDTTVSNDLTIAAGTLNGTNNFTVNGNVASTGGTIALTGGTFEQRVAANKNFGATSGSTAWSFNNLTFSNSSGSPVTITTQTGGTGGISLTGTTSATMVVGKSGDTAKTTLDAGNRTWNISASTLGNAEQINNDGHGSAITGNASTFNFNGNYGSGDTIINPNTNGSYFNVSIGNGSETYDLSAATTITGTLTASRGTFSTTASNYALTVGYISLGAIFSPVVNLNASTVTLTGTTGTLITVGAGSTFTSATSNIIVTSGSGTPTLLGSAATFHTLTINAPSATVINAGANITTDNVAGNKFYIQAGVFNLEGRTITPGTSGTLQVDSGGTFCLGGTTGATTATCDSGATQTSASTFPAFTTFTLNAASTVIYLADAAQTVLQTPSYGNLNITPKMTASRAYTMGGAMTINGNFNVKPKASAGSLALTVTLAGTTTVAATATTTIQPDATNSPTASVVTTSSNYNLLQGSLDIEANGTLDASSSTSIITVALNYTNNGTFTAGSSAVKMSSTTSGKTLAGTMTGGSAFYDLTFNGVGGAWTFSNNATISDNFTITNGSVTAPSALSVGGKWHNAGTFTHNSGTVTFTNTGASKDIDGTLNGSTGKFYNIIFDGVGGTWLLTNAAVLETANDFTINNGTVGTNTNSSWTIGRDVTLVNVPGVAWQLNGWNATVARNYVDPGQKTSAYSPSTVTLSGTGTVSGKFYNLSVAASGQTTTQNAGNIQTFGTVTFNGGTYTTTSSNARIEAHGGCVASVTPYNFASATTMTVLDAAMFFIYDECSGTTTFTENAGNFGAWDVSHACTTPTTTATTYNLAGAVTAHDFYFSAFTGTTAGKCIFNTNNYAMTANRFILGHQGLGLNNEPGPVSLSFGSSTLTANGTGDDFYITSNQGSAHTINMGSSTFNSYGNIKWVNGTGAISVTSGTSTLNMLPASGATRTFASNGQSLYNFGVNAGSSTGVAQLTGALTVRNLAITVGVLDDNANQINGNAAGTFSMAAGTTLKLGGTGTATTFPSSFTNGNITLSTTSLVVYNATVNQTISGTPTYGNLQLSRASGTPTKTLAAATTIAGNLTIDASNTLDDSTGNNYAINLAGNYTNNGTFTAQSGTVTLNGSAQQTLSGTMTSGSAFYNLTITNNSGASATDAERTGFTPSVIFAAAATSTNNYVITTANVRVQYLSGATYTFNNINWNGQATTSRIFFRNSAASGTWLLKVTGTQTAVSYVNVSRSDALTLGGPAIVANDTTDYDASNNQNWTFGSTITVSGNIYIQGSESTTNLTSVSVSIAVNNVYMATVTGQTTSYSLSGIYASAGAVVSIYIDGNALDANTITVSSGSTMINKHLYINRTAIYNDNAGSTTNSNVCAQSSFPASGDNLFTCASTVPTYTGDYLIINGSYAPGGNVNAPTMEINTGGTYTGASETLTLTGSGTGTSRPLYINGGTFTPTSDTVAFTGTSASDIEATTYYNLQLYPVSGTQTYTLNAGTVTVGGALNVGNGSTLTVAANTNNPTVTVTGTVTINSSTTWTNGSGQLSIGSSYSNSGTFTAGTGTVKFTSTASGKTLAGTMTGSSSFYNLTFDGVAGAWTLSNPVTTTNDFNVTNGSVTAGSNALTVGHDYILANTNASSAGYHAGTSTITVTRHFTDSGNKFDYGTTSSIVMTGSGTLTTGVGASINNLSIGPSGFTTTLAISNPLYLYGALTFNGGTVSGNSNAISSFASTPYVFASPTTLTGGQRLNVYATSGPKTIAAGNYGNWNLEFTVENNPNIAINLAGDITTTGTITTYALYGATNASFNTQNHNITAGGYNMGYQYGNSTTPIANNFGSSTITINGDFTEVSNGGPETIDFGTSSVSVTGNVTFVNGTGSVTVTPGTSTFTMAPPNATTKTYTPNGQSLYNFTINGTGTGKVQPAGAVVATNNFTITAGTYDTTVSNYALTIGGSYSNSGTFTANSGTVTFNATATGKTLSGTLNGTSAFYHLTFNGVGGGWTMGSASTVSKNLTITNGTLDDGGNQITGSTTGDIIIASGGTLKLGTTGTATTFPSNYGFIGNITLDPASTVIYKATVNQTIDSLATAYHYGNLQLSAASGTPTKSLNGDTNIDGNLTIDASNTLDTVSGQNYAVSIKGNYANSGTFTSRNGTVTFTSTTTGKTIATNGSNFYNLTFNGSGGDWTPSAAVTVTNDLTMTAGSLLGTQNVTVNGAVAGTAGIINLTGGIFKQLVGANKNFGTTSGSTAWTFYNLYFDNSTGTSKTITTQTGGTGGITVSNILLVGASANATTLDAGNRTWTLSGTTGGPLNLDWGDGSILLGGTSTFAFTGDNVSGTTTLSRVSTGLGGSYFYNLVINGTDTYNLSGSTTVSNNFTITAGTFDVTAGNYALSIGGSYSNSGTFTARSGTITFSSTSSGKTLAGTMTGGSAFYNLIFNGVGGAWTFSNPVATGNDFTVTNGAVSDNGNNLTVQRHFTLGSGNASNPAYTAGASTIIVGNGGTGDWINSGDKFSHGTSTVQLNGTGALTEPTSFGSTGFYNLSVAYSSKTTSTGTSVFDVFNTLTLNGGTLSGTGNFITLRLSANGTPVVFASPTTISGSKALYLQADAGSFTYTIAAGDYGSWDVRPYVQTGNNNVTYSLAGAFTNTGGFWLEATTGVTGSIFATNGNSLTSSELSAGKESRTGAWTMNMGASTVTLSSTSDGLTVASNGGSHTLNLGSSAITTAGNVLFTNGTGAMTVSAGTSTLTMAPSNAVTAVYNSGAQHLNNFVVNGTGTGKVTPSANMLVDGNLTISAGTLDMTVSNYSLTLSGNYSNSGTFTAQSGTVTLNGSAQQTVSGTTTGSSAFNNLVITNNSGASATDNERTGFTPSVIFSSDLTSTGTFTITTANVRVEYHNGSTYTFNNVTWNGQSKLTRIFFRNSVAGSGSWLLKVTGTQTGAGAGSVSSVNVSRSDALTPGGPAVIANDTTNYDATNNQNWTFGASITVSGNIYIQGSEVTTNTTPVNVSISVNNGAPSTQTGDTGSYSMSSTYDGAGTVIMVYIDGNALDANTITIGNGSSIANLNLYINRTAIYNHNSGSTTNANICSQTSYPASGDNLFTCSSTVPTYTGDYLIVNGGYAPGGNVNAPTMEINTGGTYTGGSETLTLTGSGTGTSRPLYINGGTFTPTSDTVTFTGTSASDVEATTYYNLQLYPTSGTQTYTLNSGTVTVGGALNLGNGSTLTVAANTNNPTVAVTGTVTINTGTTWTNGSGALNVNGSYSNSGTFTAGTGTVTFGATVPGKTLAGNMTGSSAFYNLTFNGANGTWGFSNAVALNAGGTFTVSNGGVTANNNNLTVGTNAGGGTFTLANVGGVSYTAGSSTITIGSDFNDAGKKLVAGTSTVALIGTGTVTHGVNETFYNLSVGYSTYTTTLPSNPQLVNGILTFNGGTVTGSSNTTLVCSVSCTPVVFASPTTLTGSRQLYYESTAAVTVTMAGGNYGSWQVITYGNANNGAYQLAGNLTTTNDLSLRSVNGITGSTFTTQNFSINAGTFTFGWTNTGAYAVTLGSSTVTLSGNFGVDNNSQGSHTLDLGTSNVTVSGNVKFADATNSSSVTVTPGTATVTMTPAASATKTYAPNGQSLYNLVINGGNSASTVQPSGAVVITNNFTITAGTYDTVSGSNYALSVAGNYANSGTFTANSGTVTFNGTAPSKTIQGTLSGSSAFYNLTFNGSGGDWTPNAAVAVTNDLTMTAGSLLGTQNITVNGNVFGTSGTITLTGGTFEQRVAASKAFGTSSGAGVWTFNNITFSNSTGSGVTITTGAGTGTQLISGNLLVGKSGDTGATTWDAGSRTWTLSTGGASPVPFQILASPAATFTPNASTIKYTGLASSGNTTIQATTYNNLVFNHAGGTFVLGGATTVAGNLTITNGTLDTGSNYALTIAGTYANNGTFTANSGTVTFTSTTSGKTITGNLSGSSSFYNLTFNGSGGDWTPNAAVAVTNDLTMTAGSLLGTQNVTVNGNVAGTAGVINLTGGTFTQSVGGAKNFGTTSGSTAWIFNNLTFSISLIPATVTTQTGGTGDITVASVLNIGASTTWNAGNRTYHLTGSGTPFTKSGTFTASTSTFSYENTTSAIITGDASVGQSTYYNLQTSPASGTPTYTLKGSKTSFLAGTQVRVPGGSKAIEDLKEGDQVTSFDSASGQPVTEPVTKTIAGTKDGYFNINDGLKVTGNHIFIMADRSQKTVEDIRVGDMLATYGGPQPVTSIKYVTENVPVYDIEVATYHLFYANDYLVHNPVVPNVTASNSFTLTGAGSATVTANTNDPQVSVGDFTIGSGQTYIASPTSGTYISGNYSNSGTFTANGGGVNFSATSGGKTIAGAMTGSSSFYYVNFIGVGGGYTFSNNATTTNDFSIGNGTVVAPAVLIVGRNFTNSGTFTANSGQVILNGSAQQTVSGTNTGASAFYDLTITNNSGASATDNERTGFTPSVIFAAAATSTGTFTDTTANSRVQFLSGATYTFNNINWNGQSKLTRIFFRNSATSGTWLLKVTGTQTAVSSVSVSRSDASVAGGSAILANDTTDYDAGNNTNWTFGATITVSGNIYIQGSEVTTNSTPVDVSISVNNGAPSTLSSQTSSYSMANVYDGAGTIIMVYIDGNALNANTITVGNGSTIANLNLYINRTAIYNHNSGNTTNANICSQSSYPTAGDTTVTCTSGVPTFTGDAVLVNGGYAPGGNVNAPTMEINTGGTYTGGSEVLTLSGSGTGTSRPLYVNSGTFTPTTNTVAFAGTSASDIESTTYYNLQLYPISGTQTYTLNSGTLTVNHNLDIGNGSTLTVAANTNNPTVAVTGNLTNNSGSTWVNGSGALSIGGSYANSGTYTAGTGTVTFNGATSGKTISGNLTGSSAFYKTVFNSTDPASNFLYKRALTVDHTKVPNTDQTNFPVLVSLTDSTLKTTGNGGNVQNSSGYDINFYSDASLSTKLNWETEKYVSTTGELEAWVKIPTLSHTSDTVFYMAYDNPTISTDQSTPTSVWDSSYKAVYHLPNGTSLSLSDSTSNAANGTNTGATATAGQVDGGAALNGTSQYITAPLTVNYSALSVSGWFNFTQNGGNPRAVADSHTDLDNKGFQLVMTSNAHEDVWFDVGNGTTSAKAHVGDGGFTGPAFTGWHFVEGTYDGSSVKLYVDGSLVDTVALSGAISSSGVNPAVGRNPSYNADYYQGSVDEVRFSNTSRSADWIATEYNNQNAPSTFVSTGTQQAGGIAADWTIQDAMTVTADATDSLNLMSGNVTMGNGTGDNLEVRGGMKVAATANQIATFQTGSIAAPGTITIDINQNNSGTPTACTNCGITVGASSGTGQGTFVVGANGILRLNPDSTTANDLPVTVNSTGYFKALGTQDYTGTSSAGTGEGVLLDSAKSWSASENNAKVVRMTSGLAKGLTYTITSTSLHQLGYTSTESATATMTVSGTGNRRKVCSNSQSLISSDHSAVGRFVHDKTGATGFTQIIDSTNNDASCAGSNDSFYVVGNPDSLSILVSADKFTLSDGVQSGDTYEVLDQANVTAEAGTACTATVNEAGKGEAYINAVAGSQLLIQYAGVCNLGSNHAYYKTGIYAASVNGGNASEGLTIDKSVLKNNYSAITADSLATDTITNNYVSGNSTTGFTFSNLGSTNTISSNTVTGSGTDGIFISGSTGGTLSNNNVYAVSQYGFQVYNDLNMTFSGNTVFGSPTGLMITNGANTGNAFTGNTFSGNYNYGGIVLNSNAVPTNTTISSNTFVANATGINAFSGATGGVVVDGNSISNSTAGASGLTGDLISNNSMHYNTYGLDLGTSSGNYVTGNTLSDNTNGIRLNGSNNNTFANNTVSNNSGSGFYTSGASTGNRLISGSYSSNGADVDLNSTASTLSLFGASLSSSTKVQNEASGSIISRNQDGITGTARVWGSYTIPSDTSETPQVESTDTYSYASALWGLSATPHTYVGTGTEDSNLDYDLSSANLSSGPYTYRLVSTTNNLVCASTTFTVYRNGSNVGTATCGSKFNDTNASVNVAFQVDGGGATKYATNDTYIFTVWNGSGDTNTKKSVALMSTGGAYGVPSGTTLAAIGTTANPTEFTRGFPAGGWHMDVAGTINAQYYLMNYLGGTNGTAGLNLQAGATVTNLANGTFDNYQDTGGASDRYISVDGSLIGTGTPSKTFDGVTFTQNASVPSYSVREAGGSPSTGNYWLFSNAVCNGWSTCEGSDSDTGDGAGSPNQDGFIRFVPTVISNPTVNTQINGGSVRVGGGTVQIP